MNRTLRRVAASRRLPFSLSAVNVQATWKTTPAQRTQFFSELGRCLYAYQAIELRLKVILPHVVVPETGDCGTGEGFETWRVFLDSKETLGPLVKRLVERVTSDEKALLEGRWRQLVDQRNEVVHHFASMPFAKLASAEDFQAAITFLEERRRFAAPMLKLLQVLARSFVTLLGPEEDDAPGAQG